MAIDDISERRLIELEILEKMKNEYDEKIKQFMHQFKSDQVQILKNEFTSEFNEVIEREKNIIQEQFQQQINQERDVHIEEVRELKERLEQERIEEIECLKHEFEERLQNEREMVKVQCLQEYRNQKEDDFCMKLRQKLEKKVRAEIESQIKDEILKDLQNNHDLESQIRDRVQNEYDKKYQQAKRKLKLELQEKETKMNENFNKNFDIEVRKKSIILLEKREIEIQRKYRLQFQKWQEKLKEEVEKKTVEIDEIKQKLNNDISELSRMKSQEQVRIKKQKLEQKQIIEEIQDCKSELEGQLKLQKIIAREKKILDVKLENPNIFKIQVNDNKNHENHLNMPLQQKNQNIKQSKSKDLKSESSVSKPRSINKMPVIYNYQDPKSEYHINKQNLQIQNQEYLQDSFDNPLISLEINNLKEDFGALQVIKQFQGSDDAAQKLAKIKQKYGSKNEEIKQNSLTNNQEQYMITLGQKEENDKNIYEQNIRGRQTWEFRRANSQKNNQNQEFQNNDQYADIIKDKYQIFDKKDEKKKYKPAENMPLIYNQKQNHDFHSGQAFNKDNLNIQQFNEDKNNFEDIFEKNKNDFYQLNKMIFQNSQNDCEQQFYDQQQLNEKYFEQKEDTLENLKGDFMNENEQSNNEELNKIIKFGNIPLLTTEEKLVLSESIKGLRYNDTQKQMQIQNQILIRKSNVSQTSGSSNYNIKQTGQYSYRTDKQLKFINEKEKQNTAFQTELNILKEVLPPLKFVNCVEEFLRNDLIEYEGIYKKKLIQTENSIQRVLENDHGLLDQLNKYWVKLNVSYKARYDYLQQIINLISLIENFQKDDCASQNTENIQQKIYFRLQDEVDRLEQYYENNSEIFELIFKREDPKIDEKYKNILGSQIVIKIDDYRRKVKMTLQSNIIKANGDTSYSNIQKNIKDQYVDDIYWRGVCYFDICRAEKEIEEINNKQKIKEEIQNKKNKYKQIQSTSNSFYKMPPKIPKISDSSVNKLNPVCPLTSRSRKSSQSSFSNINKNSQQNTSRK